MNRAAQFIGPIAIIALLCIMFWWSLSYAPRDALWPQGIIIALFLLCIKYLVDRIRETKPEQDRSRKIGWAKYRLWGTIILTIGYLFVCSWLGYCISTAVFLLVVLLLLGERNWVVLCVLPLLTPLVIYTVFFLFLHIPLPTGILF